MDVSAPIGNIAKGNSKKYASLSTMKYKYYDWVSD